MYYLKLYNRQTKNISNLLSQMYIYSTNNISLTTIKLPCPNTIWISEQFS